MDSTTTTAIPTVTSGLKEGRMFWVVATIYVTAVVIGGMAMMPLYVGLVLLAALLKSTAPAVVVVLSALVSLAGAAFGAALGTAYVVCTTNVTPRQVNNAPIWMAALSLIFGVWSVAIGFMLVNQVTWAQVGPVITLLALSGTYYAVTRWVFSHTETVRQRWTAGRIRLIEGAAVLIGLVTYGLLVFGVFNVVTSDSLGLSRFLPPLTRNDLQEVSEPYRKSHDQTHRDIASVLAHDIETNRQTVGRYPAVYDVATSTAAGLLKISGIDPKHFSYTATEDGAHYELCAELSVGKECWSDTNLPDSSSSAE